jgi:hypothetical protein
MSLKRLPGQAGDQRHHETLEVRVAVLITQSSEVQILPRLPSAAVNESHAAFAGCDPLYIHNGLTSVYDA